MGILNITPDSFYKKSRSTNLADLKKNFNLIINSDIIDIGAESTRPGSTPLTLKEELDRLGFGAEIIYLYIHCYDKRVKRRTIKDALILVKSTKK